MIDTIIGFVIGLLVGGFGGIALMALMVAAGDEDRKREI